MHSLHNIYHYYFKNAGAVKKVTTQIRQTKLASECILITPLYLQEEVLLVVVFYIPHLEEVILCNCSFRQLLHALLL
jgi:hypothetical protein